MNQDNSNSDHGTTGYPGIQGSEGTQGIEGARNPGAMGPGAAQGPRGQGGIQRHRAPATYVGSDWCPLNTNALSIVRRIWAGYPLRLI